MIFYVWLYNGYYTDFYSPNFIYTTDCFLSAMPHLIGKKSFTVACSESQFFPTFNGHIHYYSKKTRFYKCIFGGENTSTKLAEIFNNKNWETKFYPRNEYNEESPLVLERKLAIKSQKNYNHIDEEK
uniref:Uncharacterized protein n=1 Tax=Rhizophagus irregularis (strain DAOM 181602 / DAOM 197198 / MUCL 43194) TaxID=747089 RepID=U9U596_RHIID